MAAIRIESSGLRHAPIARPSFAINVYAALLECSHKKARRPKRRTVHCEPDTITFAPKWKFAPNPHVVIGKALLNSNGKSFAPLDRCDIIVQVHISINVI